MQVKDHKVSTMSEIINKHQVPKVIILKSFLLFSSILQKRSIRNMLVE